jgi:DnaB-like helicase C terminal domain
MNSLYLCDALLAHPEHYDMVAVHMDDLRWASQRLTEVSDADLHDAEPCGELLQSIVLYARDYKKLPDRKGTIDYAVEIKSKGKASGFADLVTGQLTRMDAEMKDARTPPVRDVPTDIHVLINATTETARKFWHINNGKKYSDMANGGAEVKDPDGSKHKSTPDDAIAWMRKQWTKDLQKLAPRPTGFLDENTEYIKAEIERYTQGDSERIYTGFRHIDDHLVINKKLRPFIGIMGFANDGKTTVLMTLLYNMALRGKNVVLFSKEHDPLDCWLHFAFLHSHHYRDEFILPKLSTFQEGNATQEELSWLNRIIDDVQKRVNIPGRIEVQMLTDWESLVAHLTDNHKRNHYDVVALDYLTRLDVPNCEPRWRDRAVGGYINKAQALTRQFDGGRGIVLITPIQINRSGYQSAKKKKEGEKKHDLTSVNQHSEFYQDMDFIISLFRDEKYEGDLLMEIQKVRGAQFPPNAKLRIDEYSRKVTTDSDAVTDKHWADFLNGKVQSPVSVYMRDTVIDSVFDTLDIAGKQ